MSGGLLKSNSCTKHRKERICEEREKGDVEDEIERKVAEILSREIPQLRKSSHGEALIKPRVMTLQCTKESEGTLEFEKPSSTRLPVLIEKMNAENNFRRGKYLFNYEDFLEKREARDTVFDMDIFKSAPSPRLCAEQHSLKQIRKFKSKNRENYFHSVLMKVEKSFGRMTEEERLAYAYTHTWEGLMKAFETGKFLDGSRLVKENKDRFKTRWGFIHFRDGPFWPPDFSPLHPTPHHIKGINEPIQPFTHVSTDETTNQGESYRKRLVYDQELSSKHVCEDFSQIDKHQHLEFESRFESGNLARVFRTGTHEYELYLREDLHTSGHLQWFYFRVRRMLCGVEYHFKITNLTKPKCLYLQGLKPLFYSEKEAKGNKVGWRRVGHNLAFYKTSFSNLKKPYYTFKWSLTFPHHGDTCYMSHCYPYTFTDLRYDLSTIQDSSHVVVESLCSSIAGNTCFLLSISENYRKAPVKGKKMVLITARVHPGETNSSLVVQGIISFLLTDHKLARDLRRMFLFKIVPMLNPDGVIVGNYRCSLTGVDLNRTFSSPSKNFHPSIYHLKNFVSEHLQDIFFYCDLHGHNVKNDVFMYGCPGEDVGKEHLQTMLMPWLMSKQMPEKFSFNSCTFEMSKSKLSTGRCVFRRHFNITHCYTLETSFCGSQMTREHFTNMDYRNFGRELCLALKILEKSLMCSSLKQRFYEKIQNEIVQEKLNKENEERTRSREEILADKEDPDNSSSNEDEEEENEHLKSMLYRRIIKHNEKMEKRIAKKRNLVREPIKKNKFQKSFFEDKLSEIDGAKFLKISAIERLSKANKEMLLCKFPRSPHPTSLQDAPKTWKGTKKWKSKYEGQHNNGIPCFVDLRIIERIHENNLPALHYQHKIDF